MKINSPSPQIPKTPGGPNENFNCCLLFYSFTVRGFVLRNFVSILALQYFDGEERDGCFALFVFLVSRDCCVALPHDATGLSVVCECGIS